MVAIMGLLFFACGRKQSSLPAPNKTEVKEIRKQLNINIKRYEEAIFSIPKDSLANELMRLRTEFAFFLGDNPASAENLREISGFLNEKINRQLYKEVQKQFPNLTDMEKQFAEAFSLLLYYFPDAAVPQIYTFISGLDYQSFVIYYADTLLIPLDLFLGKDYKLYRQLGSELPQFIKRRFSSEYILPSCFGEISYKYIKSKPLKSNLLDAMIDEGKRLLFMEMMLPNCPDSLIFPFPQEKIEWVRQNEANVWGYLIQNDLLYSKNMTMVRKMVGDAPFTSYFGNNSPGKTGAWIGWQICRTWVQKNPQKKVTELFNETDAQKILTASKYKPQK